MDGGWRIVSLWDSEEQFQEFLRDRLHLTLDEASDEQPTVTVWEIESCTASPERRSRGAIRVGAGHPLGPRQRSRSEL
jgi:hypothetical protein